MLGVPVVGLAVALAGAPSALMLFRLFGLKQMSWAERVGLWVIGGLGVAIAIHLQGGVVAGLLEIGIGAISLASIAWGLGGAIGIFLATGITMAGLRLVGLPIGDPATFNRLAELPVAKRGFIVLTAAVVEEALYRGCAISFGADLLGGTIPAALLSLLAFVLAHLRWRASHLISVTAAGSILTVLYIHTGDLWACIIAHLIVDAVGFLIMPALMKGRTTRKAPS